MTESMNWTPFLLILSLIFVHYVQKSRTNKRLLFPGPRPFPVFGNIFNIPTHKPWVTYRDWSKQYGSDIISLDLPHQPTIILNSSRAVLDLLEGQRARDTADKPQTVMDELTGWSWNLGLQPYGSRWRLGRRLFHQYFNQSVVQEYHPIQAREIRAFLKRAAKACENGGSLDPIYISQMLAAIISDITYGIRIHDFNHKFISLTLRAVEALVLSRSQGAFWAEYFPWLKYIPSWVPGSSARALGERYNATVNALHSEQFDVVMKDVINGTATSSVAQKLARKLHNQSIGTESYETFELSAKDATAVSYAAAVDTQYATLSSFLVGMSLFPQAQRQAQQQLDSVIGLDRLPTIEDIPSLPYIQAIFMEALRWMPVLPLGVPHRIMADDEYNGFLIPAGTVIIANTWAMLHDPEEYPDPETFNPDRFIRDGTLNLAIRDSTAAFGFGRRKCPGRHLAKDTLLLTIASILAVFNIEPTADKDNAPVGATSGFVSYPESLPCRLVSRNAAAMDLINSVST